jgi:DeoR family transcriptional regulator of aga operon
MDKQGDVKRTRGGAERVAQQRYDLPLPEREQLNRREKQAIALAACKLIQTRDSVFLDASSTVLEMTRFFPSKDLTVITNANHVVVALGDRLDVNLICTGGEYERRSRSYVGMVAEDAVQRYYLQWMFIGVDGLDAARGASEVNPGQARLKERILPMAENVCILADHTKLGRKSPFFFAKTNQFKYLITDAAASAAAVEPFREAGITIIRASVDELNY